MAVLVFFTTCAYVRNVPLGQPPDEWAQLSYIADIASGGPPIPEYANSTILVTGQQNYLSHPPLYYTVTATIGAALSWDPVKDYQAYRFVSALMVAAGVYLWVLIAMRLGFGVLCSGVLTLATLAIPMFPYLAGSINNDNLVYLGVALFFYGVSLLPRSVPRAAWVTAAGLLVVLLTKATGAVFLLAFMAAWVGLGYRDALSLSRDRHVRMAATAVAILAASYYLPTFIRYHTFFPAPGTLYQEYGPPAHPVGLLQFAGEFTIRMIEHLPFVILTRQSLFPIPTQLFPLFYFMLGLPLVAWLSVRLFRTTGPQRRVSDAFLLALLITVGAHLAVSWHGYLQTGLYGGLQPRYYSYALPGLFLVAFHDGLDTRRKRAAMLVFSLLVVFFVAIIPPRAALALHMQQRAREVTHLVVSSSPLEPSGTLPTDPALDAGYLDHATLGADTAQLSGWAIDVASRHPARALWVRVAGHLIGTAQPTLERPDVVAVTGSHAALRSGFVVTVSHVPPNLSPCDFSVQAEQGEGVLVTLKHPGCPTAKGKP